MCQRRTSKSASTSSTPTTTARSRKKSFSTTTSAQASLYGTLSDVQEVARSLLQHWFHNNKTRHGRAEGACERRSCSAAAAHACACKQADSCVGLRSMRAQEQQCVDGACMRACKIRFWPEIEQPWRARHGRAEGACERRSCRLQCGGGARARV